MTLAFRVAVLEDGNGKRIYRPETKHWYWPFYRRCTYMDSPYSYCVIQFDTQQEADDWVNRTKADEEWLKRARKIRRVPNSNSTTP